ncbi:sporulation protein YqfD [Pseudogracilibacillus sp. SE30717A]|uniref:sporulation protein YqfD n=1 Tax=Pseudogracilibacillus sp. SE30717A TaxID=3098293 RepID=UPI00300E6688
MKRVQGKNIVGYITVQVQGEQPEYFFQLCADQNIIVWNVKKLNNKQCLGKVYLVHLNKVKAIADQSPYTIEVINKGGYLNRLERLWNRKELVISIVLSISILFFLSNIIWKVEVNGVTEDIENKLNKELAAYGLYEGAWSYSLESLDIVQQQILHKIPELLYIGIEKKGTTYTVDAVEKLIVKEEEPLPAQHLIAAKNGIIQKMFIKKGSPAVTINDYVQKGDLLVNGTLEEDPDEEDENEEIPTNNKIIISAEGKVYATTWYEISVSSSMYHHEEKLTGDKHKKYYLNIGNVELPIWGFKEVPYEQFFEEKINNPLYLIKWKLPFSVTEKTIYNKASFNQVRSEEEAKNIAIEHVKNDLQLKLGKDSEIIKYYVLHESVENGKVKLNLYISVLENIAIGKIINID